MSNRAWVTLATNDSYGLGALVLAHSLRRVSSEHPAVVLITPSVTDAMRERLDAVFSEVVIVDVLDSRDAAHLALLQRPELGITFTKIHCWSLTQFEKCVFLDADTLLITCLEIDFSACISKATVCRKMKVVQNCDELFEREELSAAPDVGWPDCFNSGVFVFKPSKETFDRLIAFAQERGSFDGGDQGLLNSFFSDWARADINKHLPFLYNVTSAAFYSYLPALKHFGQDLKIIHFIGAAKPWLQHFNFESRTVDAPDHIRGLLQLWWDIFVGQVHSQLDASMVEVEEPSETQAPPPALPPQDVNQHYHYQPVIDPESEFPWHRPEAQIPNNPDRNVEITDIQDRWETYRGNIPPMSEHHSEADVGNRGEMRKYAWDYLHQQIVGQEHIASEGNSPSHNTHSYQHSEHQHLEYNSHNEQQHFDHYAHGEHDYNQSTSSHDQPSHHNSFDHFHQDDNHHHIQQYDDSQNQTHHTTQSKEDHQPETFYHFDEPNTHLYHKIDNLHKHNVPVKNNIEVFHVHVQQNTKKRRPHRHRIDLGIVLETNTFLNGDVSESECDYFEDNIIPRHPYDGFYLRHRATIDSRGRKVCTHEIPPTPSPTPSPPESPTPQEYETAEEIISSDIEDHTGVAGNLALVVAGGSHEALDELTRRQGWESGNIDYMGADSFDKIWAKISQTLTEPRSPSPPKENPPQEISAQAVEVAEAVVSEPVTVVKEAVLAATLAPAASKPVPNAAPAPVPVPVEKPIPAPLVEPVPLPVKQPIPAPVAKPAPVATPVKEPAVTTAAPVKKAPEVIPPKVQTPAPAASAKVETLIAPMKSAAIDDIPVTVVAEEPVKEAKKTESVGAPAAAKTVIAPSTPPVPKTPEATTPETIVLPSCPVATDNILVTDSPPLANTPSKEEAGEVPVAKSEERERRKVSKLQLSPPAARDPLPTPDSEAEDASTLAHAIIASELRAIQTPTVTSPQTPGSAEPASPLTPKAGLTVAEPQVPTPPVGSAVSLAQIGVKPKEKTTTAAQLESSIAAATEKPDAPKDAPKKKIIKKVVKKVDKEAAAAGVDAPVPPPRKKEKKPKEK